MLSLQITPTHFTLSSYERTLCLPSFFPTLDLDKLDSKTKTLQVLESLGVYSLAHARSFSFPTTAFFSCSLTPSSILPSFIVELTVFTLLLYRCCMFLIILKWLFASLYYFVSAPEIDITPRIDFSRRNLEP